MAKSSTSAVVLLSVLFLVGFGLNLWPWIDYKYFHLIEEWRGTALPEVEIEGLKQSILSVRVGNCEGPGFNFGTGFVVEAGYIATAAHVIDSFDDCDGGPRPIQVVDHRGIDHTAEFVAMASESDLAILKINDFDLPPVALADSSEYENVDKLSNIVTIGYPLLAEGASAVDEPAVSGEGNISRYDASKNVFITSGLNLNPGNSGGPIFLSDNWLVVGVAVKKFDVNVGEGLGVAVPSRTFANLFKDKTGQELILIETE